MKLLTINIIISAICISQVQGAFFRTGNVQRGEISLYRSRSSSMVYFRENKNTKLFEEAIKFENVNEPDSGSVDNTYVIVEKMPEFEGSDPTITFRNYIDRNVVYPAAAEQEGIDGRVIIHFTVDTVGKVTNAKVLQSAHRLLDKEAIRVIESSPPWTPGMQDGKKVPVLFTYPIKFKIRCEEKKY